MKIKALVTVLVLGSSSVALADHDSIAKPTVRDHRAPIAQPYRPAPAPVTQVAPLARPYTPAPVTQTAPVTRPPSGFRFAWSHFFARPQLLANDTHLTGRAVINLPATTRAFTKLELRSNNGRTSIQRVLITYGNGQRQVLALNKVVTGKNSVTIDLAGGARHIKSVMLLGNSTGRATIDVIGV